MENKADIDALRTKFKHESLNQPDLPADPYLLFATWLRQAEEAELPYPTGMSLATASPTGEVSSRIVLLRYFDQSGFVFFSGYDTKKGGTDRAEPPGSAVVSVVNFGTPGEDFWHGRKDFQQRIAALFHNPIKREPDRRLVVAIERCHFLSIRLTNEAG